MGFLGGLSFDLPGVKNWKPPTDPETEAALGKISELANKPISQMQSERMPNEQNPEAIKAQIAEGQNLNKALGMATPDQLTDVLNKRAQKKYAADLSAATRLSEPSLYSKKAQALMKSQQLFARRGQVEMEIAEGYRKLEQDKKAARNSTLGSILGVAGAIGGGLIAGPGGAVAGAQLGKVGGE